MAIIRNEPIATYHASGAFGKTALMDLAKYGAADFKARHRDRTLVRKRTPALRFGSLFDALMEDEAKARTSWAEPLTESAPRKPTQQQRDAKNPSPATLNAIDWWDDYLIRNAGKEEVDEGDRERLEHMLAACRACPVISALWARCEKQVTIRRELEIGGQTIAAQSRPDGLILDAPEGNPLAPVGGILVDIKTCRDITRFPADCLTYGYHVQLSLGQWLLAKEGYQVDAVLIAVESKAYPRTKAFRLPEIALNAGWLKVKALLSEVARRIRDNDWTEPQAAIEDIDLPDWTVRQLAAEGEA